jgi:hypothetical protein
MTLISILGEFHSSTLPIFFEFKDKIKHHIIIHDNNKNDKQNANKLIHSQQEFLKNTKIKLTKITIDKDNYDNIINVYDYIIKNTEDSKRIYLNATDGLNSVALVLSNKILDYGANVIVYDKYTNRYSIHTKDQMTQHTISNNIGIENHLHLKGYNLIEYTKYEILKKRKKTIFKLTKNLTEYKRFVIAYPNETSKYNYYYQLIRTLNIPKRQIKMFLEGIVFEEYIYWLIKDNTEVDDIITSASIEFDSEFKNEIDVLFIKNNHLHGIECKFTKNFKGSEYVYKADSIMDHLDDDGKYMLLNVASSSPFTNGDKIRARKNNIIIYSIKKFNKQKFLNQLKYSFNL